MTTSISAEALKLGEEALVFISNGCPTVRVYDDRLKALQARYGPAGVQVVAINSNNPFLSPADTSPEMARRAEEAGYNFPYLKDEDGGIARSYGAMTTPHAFVFDSDRRLRYRGRIDDSRDPSKLTSHDLQTLWQMCSLATQSECQARSHSAARS